MAFQEPRTLEELYKVAAELDCEFMGRNEELLEYERAIMKTIEADSDEELKTKLKTLLEADEYHRALKDMCDELYTLCQLANRAHLENVSITD